LTSPTTYSLHHPKRIRNTGIAQASALYASSQDVPRRSRRSDKGDDVLITGLH
jgi:hypothetical protein